MIQHLFDLRLFPRRAPLGAAARCCSKRQTGTDERKATTKEQRWNQPSWEFTALTYQARRGRKHPRVPAKTGRGMRDVSAKSARYSDQNAVNATEGGGDELAEDLLLGAVAIAKEMNWRDARGRWNVRRVYHLNSKGTLPIHHVRGLGICARRSSLRNFFTALDHRVKAPSRTATR